LNGLVCLQSKILPAWRLINTELMLHCNTCLFGYRTLVSFTDLCTPPSRVRITVEHDIRAGQV